MSIYGWFVVILVTSIAVMLGAGWLVERGQRQLDRIVLLDQLEQATANVQPLPRAGRLDFAGAQDPAFEVPEPDPMALAAAAYQLGQERARQEDTARENEILWMIAEYDAQQAKRCLTDG